MPYPLHYSETNITTLLYGLKGAPQSLHFVLIGSPPPFCLWRRAHNGKGKQRVFASMFINFFRTKTARKWGVGEGENVSAEGTALFFPPLSKERVESRSIII
jgi:hypothetical protein